MIHIKLTKSYNFWYNIFLDTTIIGQVEIRDEGDCYSIWSFNIYHKHRNKGYGRQVVNLFPKDKKLMLLVEPDNKIAIKLYESIGLKYIMFYEGNMWMEREAIKSKPN